MMKRLFSRLLTTKSKRFDQNLEHESKQGILLEVDLNRQWFVVLAHYAVEELKSEGGAPNLILFRKKGLSTIARMRLVVIPERSELFIGDFTSDIENKGYGNILLRNVIKLAELLESRAITGNLSAADSDHFDKLRHIYEKFGFEVNIQGKEGTIKKRMQL